MNPRVRVIGAWVLLVLSIIGGVLSTIYLATESYERVLMAISWGAISITALDVLLTADVRANK